MGIFDSKSKKALDRQWWTKKGEELGEAVVENYLALRDQSHNKPGRYHALLSLYLNRNVESEVGQRYMEELVHSSRANYNRAKFNLIKLLVDTVHNRIAKLETKAKFLPVAGSPSVKKRAKSLERWSDSIADKSRLHKVGPLVFLDALLFGIGILKPYAVGKEIKVERVYPGEVFVDQVEAAYDNVRQMFHRKYIAREVVLYHFAEMPYQANKISDKERARRRKAILSAARSDARDDIMGAHSVVTDPIEVVEAWHLPSGPGAPDGLHVIAVEGCLLLDEPWEREKFPFAFVRWSHDPRGFYGLGLAEELYGIHVDVNSTIERIEESMALNASPYIMVEERSKVKKSHIANIPGIQLQYRDTIPRIETVNTVPPEFLNYLNDQVARAYRIAKINTISSGNKIPSGLETGAAVREWSDTDKEDFAVVMKEYQEFYMDAIAEFVHLGEKIYKDYPDYTVVASKDRHTVTPIAWKDVNMDEDSFVLRVEPASSLPSTPAGKIAAVTDLINAGLIDQARGLELLHMPDLEGEMDLMMSERTNIDRMIELILDEGEPQVLESGIDADLVVKKGQAAYNKAASDGVPEYNLTILRDFISQGLALVRQRFEQEQLMMQQSAAMQQPPLANTGT